MMGNFEYCWWKPPWDTWQSFLIRGKWVLIGSHGQKHAFILQSSD
jgi:hypothetical protein